MCSKLGNLLEFKNIFGTCSKFVFVSCSPVETQDTMVTGTDDDPLLRREDSVDSWLWFCWEMIMPAGPAFEMGFTGDCRDAIKADGWFGELRVTWIESWPAYFSRKSNSR